MPVPSTSPERGNTTWESQGPCHHQPPRSRTIPSPERAPEHRSAGAIEHLDSEMERARAANMGPRMQGRRTGPAAEIRHSPCPGEVPKIAGGRQWSPRGHPQSKRCGVPVRPSRRRPGGIQSRHPGPADPVVGWPASWPYIPVSIFIWWFITSHAAGRVLEVFIRVDAQGAATGWLGVGTGCRAVLINEEVIFRL